MRFSEIYVGQFFFFDGSIYCKIKIPNLPVNALVLYSDIANREGWVVEFREEQPDVRLIRNPWKTMANHPSIPFTTPPVPPGKFDPPANRFDPPVL